MDWPDSGLSTKLSALRNAELARANVFMKRVLFIALPIAAYLIWKENQMMMAGAVALIAFFVITDVYGAVNGINEAEYRALPGSTDASGRHHCVYCGHVGVYKRGAYRSNTVWHTCTACKKVLFTT